MHRILLPLALALGAVPPQEAVPERALVRWRAGTTAAERAAALEAAGDVEGLRSFDLVPGLQVVRHPRGSLQRLRRSLGERALYVEADAPTLPAQGTSDPLFADQHGLHNTGQVVEAVAGLPGADLRALEAWARTTGSDSVTVAIIDTGMDLTHPDLAPNLWVNGGEVAGNGLDEDGNGLADDLHGWDFFANDADPTDESGHGTHVAGIIGARGNNGLGVAGVSWRARLLPLRTMGPSGGSLSHAIAALDYCAAMGIRLSNHSWTTAAFSQALLDAFEALTAGGHLAVVAAGNQGRDLDTDPVWPAAFDLPGLLTVAATDARDELASFSNYGQTTVNLAAPGVAVVSTLPGGYGALSGTSMATPMVTGTAALLMGWDPGLSAVAVADQLVATSRPVTALLGRTRSGGVACAGACLPDLGGTDLTPPDAPIGLRAETQGARVVLQWSASTAPDLNGYRVERWDGAAFAPLALGLHQEERALDPSAPYGSLQRYRVRAVDFSGNASNPSAEVEHLVGGSPGTQVLAWEGFEAPALPPHWSVSGSTPAAPLAGAGSAGSRALHLERDQRLALGLDASGFGDLTLEAWLHTDGQAHGARARMEVSSDGGATWSACWVKAHPVPERVALRLPAGLADAAFLLRLGVDDAGPGTYARFDEVRVRGTALGAAAPDMTAPRPPMGLAATGHAGAVRLAWLQGPELDLAGVQVFRRLLPGGALDLRATLAAGVQLWTDASVMPGIAHEYHLRAFDLGENLSPASAVAVATPSAPPDTTPPTPPTGLSAVAGNGTVTLDWTPGTEADLAGYRILRSPAQGAGYSFLPGLHAGPPFTDTGLQNGVQVWYRLLAEDSSGNVSGFSDEVSGIPTDGLPEVVFFEGFESGNLQGWNALDGNADAAGAAALVGAFGAELRKDTWIRRVVSTAGFRDLTLEVSARALNMGAGEELRIEVHDGTGWLLLASVTSGSWAQLTFPLGPAADDNPGLQVRLETTGDASSEVGHADELRLIGTRL
jgi:subtilisin family serine protease